MIRLIIFSMDRALQCDSLLRSLSNYASGLYDIVVIVRTSSHLHLEAYDRLAALHPRVRFWRQTLKQSASMLLSDALDGADFISLAVDDQVYFAPVDFMHAAMALEDERAFVWSWRLGHTLGITEYLGTYWRCPSEIRHRDYGYVFHTDGSLYRRKHFVAVLDRCLPDWRRGPYIPNDIERACAAARETWARSVGPHLGPYEQACITFQINKEQTTLGTYGAPWRSTPGTRLDQLAQAFLNGAHVANGALYDTIRTALLPAARAAGLPTHVPATLEAAMCYESLVRYAS